MEVKGETISVDCEDGEKLVAELYQANFVKGVVVVGPATGIKHTFYAPFASYIANHGYAVITFSNRGIGPSLVGKLRGSKVSLQDWGILDLKAVLKEMIRRYPDTTYHLIGHSAGGQLIGLMDNAHQIRSMFNFACSSGNLNNMRKPYVYKARFFMDFYMPMSNLLFGYAKNNWVGMGEPLPKKVAQQWTEWCNGRGYVKTAFGKTIHTHLYDELTLPSQWVYASDDEIANEINVKEMIAVLPKSKASIIELKPSELGFNDIGHMKFFSRSRKSLWNLALDWLDKHCD